MTNKQIFQNETFNLPKNRNGEDLLTYVSQLFDNYQELLNQFDGDLANLLDEQKDLIGYECDQLCTSIEQYQNGFPSKAYVSLKECLDRLKNEGCLPIQESTQMDGLDELYRVRASKTQLSKKGLFHIPFQLREKVATQRYSIPGFPCIYLGDSIYVCWEELNKPEIVEMNVCRYDLNSSDFKFLYLNDTPDDLRKKCFLSNSSGKPEFMPALVKFLIIHPLLAACSIQVYKRDEVFKPEYIIPQLLLQWIVDEQELDGVKYRSNQVSIKSGMDGSFMNVVIPVKAAHPNGFCPELVSRIKLTEPISWKLLDISNEESNPSSLTIPEISSSVGRVRSLELVKGEVVDYTRTKFGVLESKLQQMSASKIV